MYEYYKFARNRAWTALIECKIDKLPVNLAIFIKHYNINVIKYSKSKQKNLVGDGFCTKFKGKFYIYYNDSDYSFERQRFTIAHEIGHCLLGHVKEYTETFRYNNEIDNYNDIKEIQANIFARDILMPAIVLHALNVGSALEISKLCKISIQSAEIRWQRLIKLNERKMFNKHPLERQVYKQFQIYIEGVTI